MATATEYLSRDQTAAVLGVTVRSLSRYAQADDPLVPATQGGHGKPTLYCPEQVGAWLVRRELQKLQRAAGHEDALDYHAERTRLTAAQADHQELRNREMRRELADVRLVSFAVANFGSQAGAIFETLPGRIKRAQPDLSNEAINTIRRAVVELQNCASELNIDWDESPELDE